MKGDRSMRKQNPPVTGAAHALHSEDGMAAIQEKIRACMQCGTCSGSCANSFAMDHTPRQLWRLVQLGEMDEIFASKTFTLCSNCYYCTLRCPRGLPLTETIHALKRLAVSEGRDEEKKSTPFYRSFLATVQRYGRVREMELMTRYFLTMKNPFLPLGFTPLGLKLMFKGKLPLHVPQLVAVKDKRGKAMFFEGRFDRLFRKVEELERSS